ncbi:hypothetical protein AAHA92_29780 [Salvia divinorum]|uniref:Uncharacterized protein n=1 Tax=Salvia divinorum TaxID=28513 RepID=A0ABD1FZI4_SALDI
MMSQGGHGGLSVVPLLLQERFRQLQVMKEMREERELVRMLLCSNYTTSSSGSYTTSHYSYCFREQPLQAMLPPAKPQCQLSLSLWPDWRGEEGGRPRMSPSKSLSSFFADQNSASDIDTSLHL